MLERRATFKGVGMKAKFERLALATLMGPQSTLGKNFIALLLREELEELSDEEPSQPLVIGSIRVD